MTIGVNLVPDATFIDCRIEYDVTTNSGANTTTVNAYFRVRSSGTVNSQGDARFAVWIKNSSGTKVDTATRTSNTTIINDNTWRTYATATYTFTNNSTNGSVSYYVGGGVSSGTDPLIGSSWDSLPSDDSSLITTNYQLYPVVPSFYLGRSSIDLPSNTSSVSFLIAPSKNITTNTGTITSTTGAVLTQQYAVSTTSTPGTYSTFVDPTSISPLDRVWVKVTSTADSVTVDRSGNSTANIIETIYGYPSKPTSISLSKTGRQVTVTYGNSATNGGYDTSPTYTIERSLNNGTTWEAHNNSDLLTPAATYIFRVYATNSTGTSEAIVSSSIFISAYGYRFTSSTTKIPIETAARYTGNSGDSVVVNGTTYTGWKAISKVQKYTAGGWIDLTS